MITSEYLDLQLAGNLTAAAIPDTLLTGLADYWLMNEAAGPAIASFNHAHDLADTGGTGTVLTPVGPMRQFNAGAGTALACPMDAGLAGTGAAYTVNYWVYAPGDLPRGSVVSGLCGLAGCFNEIQATTAGAPGQFAWGLNTFAGAFNTIGNMIAEGTVYMVSEVYDGSLPEVDRVQIYKNAVRVQRTHVGAAPAALVPGADPLTFGTGPTGHTSVAMGNAGLWTRALTPAELARLFGEGVPPPPPWTHFDNHAILFADDGTGAPGTVLAGRVPNLATTGGQHWLQRYGAPGSPVASVSGGRMVFDAAGGSCSLDPGPGDYTATYRGAIVSSGGLDGNYHSLEVLLRYDALDPQKALWFHMKYQGDFEILHWDNATHPQLAPTAMVAGWTPDALPHTVIFRCTGNRIRVYLDGVKLLDGTPADYAGNTQVGTGWAIQGAPAVLPASTMEYFEVRRGDQFPPYPEAVYPPAV